jgi:hypothetical protein
MIKVTYTTYSKILDKSFVNVKEVKSMSDFNLFAMSLNLHITKIETEQI